MDPRDDLDSLAGGVDCAACGQVVPTDRVRVLARRDDIAFVEIHCAACRSESLGIVIAGAGDDPMTAVPRRPGRAYGEFGPGDEERFREALPDRRRRPRLVHDLLARGGIAALVGRLASRLPAGPAGDGAARRPVRLRPARPSPTGGGPARRRSAWHATGASPRLAPPPRAAPSRTAPLASTPRARRDRRRPRSPMRARPRWPGSSTSTGSRWEYEPHTFPILWNLDGAVVESFSPDFWLPDLDLYLEMTTLRQKLVRKKNRKLRRVRELYPDLRVKLFYARDFRALLLKFGRLAPRRRAERDVRPGRARAPRRRGRRGRPADSTRPGAPTTRRRAWSTRDRARSISPPTSARSSSAREIAAKVAELGARIGADYGDRPLTLVSVLKGSLPFMADLMRAIPIPVRIDLMEVSSYGGTSTESSGPRPDPEGPVGDRSRARTS